jgi:hypothetical protein
MSFLVRTPCVTVAQAETLRIIIRLYHAQLLQSEIEEFGGQVDPLVATEAIIRINDIFESYYYLVNAAMVQAKRSPDGKCQLVLRESQWMEIWKLCYLKWSSDTEAGAQILNDFQTDLKSLQEAMDDPPMTKADMLDIRTTPSGRTNTNLN